MKEKTFLYKVFEKEKEEFGVSNSKYEKSCKELEGVLSGVENYVGDTKDFVGVVNKVESFLSEKGFVFRDEFNSFSFLESLNEREGTCAHSSLLNYSIAERLGFNLNFVLIPEHVFVRYNEGDNYFNWDTIIQRRKQGFFTDEDYALKFNIPEDSIKKGVYLRGLEGDEIWSLIYSCWGDRIDESERDKVISYYEKAISLCLKSPSPQDYMNIGFMMYQKKDFEKALSYFDTAIDLDKGDVCFYVNRGIVRQERGEFCEAISDFDSAINLIEGYNEKYKSPCERNFYSKEFLEDICERRGEVRSELLKELLLLKSLMF